MKVILILLGIVLLYWIVCWALTRRRRLRYNISQADQQTVGNQLFMAIPLTTLDNSSNAGTVYTKAVQYPRKDNSGLTDVVLDLTYVLDDGFVSHQITYCNPSTAGTVFAKDAKYKSSITGGSGAYISGRGTVELKVNTDGSREVSISCW